MLRPVPLSHFADPDSPPDSSTLRQEAREPLAPHLRLVPRPVELPAVLRRRDPETVRRVFPTLARITDSYYRAEVEGQENLSDGRCMMVSTHNGGLYMPDLQCLMVAFLRRFGLETPGYGMTHGIVFQIPFAGSLAAKLGAIQASRENARAVFDAGFPLLVCPGGDEDSLKPFSKRHQVCFGKRRGFIRTAIENQVPIVPIVSVGAHEIFYVMNDGRRFAQMTGIAKWLRIKSVPFALAFPFGLTIAGVGAVPLPTKITLRVLPKIELAEKPAAASDPATVERCFEHVRQTMQRGLDGLAAKRKRVVIG